MQFLHVKMRDLPGPEKPRSSLVKCPSRCEMAIGRLDEGIKFDSSRIMLRSMALRSSRTLPGQSLGEKQMSRKATQTLDIVFEFAIVVLDEEPRQRRDAVLSTSDQVCDCHLRRLCRSSPLNRVGGPGQVCQGVPGVSG